MSRAPEGPVPVSSEGVEILSPTTRSDLAREVARDGELLTCLEERRGFTESAWDAWREVVLDYCSQHYREARSTGEVEFHDATERNLRRALALSWGASS